jgi:protein TonB
MNVTIDSSGQVIETDVVRSSQNALLDKRAVSIVRAAAPFGVFSDDMRKKADQLVITSRFKFTRNDGLETTLSAPQAQ